MRASAISGLFGFAAGQITPCYDCVEGVVMGGADVVAYFSMSEGDRGILGSSDHQVSYRGYKFHFSNADNVDVFNSNPEKYMPAWGGF
jgi:YHS domain-containing protein